MFLITKCREQVLPPLIKLSAHILDITFPRKRKPKPMKEFLKTAEFFVNVKITSNNFGTLRNYENS